MGVYGPNTAVLGSVVTVSGLDPNADRLFVENRSIYDLAIAFGDQAPTAVQTLNGGQWVATVPPGGKTIAIPFGQFGGGHFNGTVYALALNPESSAQALTGTVSANATFYVQTVARGEAAPADYTRPEFVNAASQQRVVSISAQPNYAHIGAWAVGLADTDLFPAIWSSNLIPSGQTISGFVLAVYVVYAYFSPDTSAIGGTQFKLQFVVKDGSGTVLSTTDLLFANVAQANSNNPVMTTFSVGPGWLGRTLALPAGAASGWLRLHRNSGVSTYPIDYTIYSDLDWWNQQKPAGIGGGAGGRVNLQNQYTPSGAQIPQLY